MPIYSPTGFLDITNATLRTSNVEAENLLMTGGNIYVTSELETDATVLNLENVTRKGNVSSNTIEITNVTTGIVATGNVHASKFIGSGSHLTGIPPSAITGTLSQWSDGTNGDVYIASNVGIANAHTLTSNTLQVGGNLYVRDTGSNVLTVNGNVVANYFEGDGSKLSGIVTDLQGVTDNGNVTTNVVQFSNVTTGLVTTANIEVGGDLKIDGLTAGKVPYVAADKFLKDSFITTTGDATVISSNLDVTGNIFMRGEKFIVESETKLINDAIIGIANNNTSSTTDKGIIMQNTTGNVAIIHHGTGDGFADQLTFGYTADPLDTITVTNDLTKELTVNILGNVITQNNLSVGGTLKINNITAAAQHSLQAVTNVGNVTSNTVQFSNAITSLVASSNIVATGNVSAGHDTNTTSYFGRAAVGYMGTTDQASFAHVDHNDPARYAIKQMTLGQTYINTPASGYIGFTVNDGDAGAEKMRITSAGKVGIGATAPDATLHVVGNAYVSSNLIVSGNVEMAKQLTVSGNVEVSSNLTVSGTGQTSTSSFDQAGALGSTLILKDDGGNAGNGGAIMFGASQGYFAAIKGGIDNGANNTSGRITFFTRPDWTNSTMTSAMTIDYTGTLVTRAHVTSISATGGTISNADGFRYHTFTSSGSFQITSGGGDVEYLLVGGGGGGGGGNAGGGGGGGGVITGKIANMGPGTHTITVGGGGAGTGSGGTAGNGGSSSFGSLKSVNGGGRGQAQGGPGANTGGSGGGSAGGGGSGTTSTASGAGRDGEGNRGGNGWYESYQDGGGGGGGAGSHGVDASKNQGGNGGGGLAVWGTTYGGGGGGCCYNANTSYGGNGGGGNGGSSTANGGNGTGNTGGGGGAGTYGGSGGTGIVILRYVV